MSGYREIHPSKSGSSPINIPLHPWFGVFYTSWKRCGTLHLGHHPDILVWQQRYRQGQYGLNFRSVSHAIIDVGAVLSTENFW